MRGSLAVRLQTLRASQGLTLTEASEQLGINRHTLSRLEAGTQRPYGPTLKKLAKGYGVDVGDLIEEPAPPGTAEPAVPLGEAPSPPPEAEATEEERRLERIERVADLLGMDPLDLDEKSAEELERRVSEVIEDVQTQRRLRRVEERRAAIDDSASKRVDRILEGRDAIDDPTAEGDVKKAEGA